MRVISDKRIKYLTRDSFESKIERIREALDEVDVFEGESYRILGSFPSHVVVMSESGKGARVKYTEDLGDYVVESWQELEFDSYTDNAVADLLKTEAEDVLRLWSKGNKRKALEQLESLVSMSARVPSPTDETISLWEEALGTERQWEKVLVSKKELIDEVLDYKDSDNLHTKFNRLYDLKQGASHLGESKELVNREVLNLRDTFRALKAEMRLLENTVTRLESSDKDSVRSLCHFVADLNADLERVSVIAENAPYIGSVAKKAKVHDLLITKLARGSLAKSFVAEMATVLTGGEIDA